LNRLALPFDVFFEDLSELRPGGRRLRKYDPCGGRYRDEDTSDLQQLTTNECHGANRKNACFNWKFRGNKQLSGD
jgi:hypothetical protein